MSRASSRVTVPSLESPSSNDPLHGTAYRALRLIERTGGGVVYLAEHRNQGHEVVVKVLLEALGRHHDLVVRLRGEAASLAALDCPHIVPMRDFGETSRGAPFFVTDRFEGRTLLEELSERGRLEVGEALDVAEQASLGLAAAHGQGIVHRDVQPATLLLGHDDVGNLLVRIADFGVARIMSRLVSVAPSAFPSASSMVIGMPRFWAPEQALGKPIDARSDVYSVGMVLYWMLAGRGPFEAKTTAIELVRAHVLETPMPPSRFRSGLPEVIDALVLEALAKDPNDRPQSAIELVERLDMAVHLSGLGRPMSWPSPPSDALEIAPPPWRGVDPRHGR